MSNWCNTGRPRRELEGTPVSKGRRSRAGRRAPVRAAAPAILDFGRHLEHIRGRGSTWRRSPRQEVYTSRRTLNWLQASQEGDWVCGDGQIDDEYQDAADGERAFDHVRAPTQRITRCPAWVIRPSSGC